ncbi:MAG: glycerophosphodiester phosphodiesterase family protein, partial [Alphaproteobacteria bacterium]|nr:glycerophosphodiester phosphodiesterase family protein [Alphaproteobacteria bacterium]
APVMTILPPINGHRGAAAHAPENTIEGIRKAAARGVRGVELDVAVTQDGGAVLFHDKTVERTTDGQGQLNAHTIGDLARRDAGSWFHPDFAGAKIPTLAQALAVLQELDLKVNLEIKPQPGEDAATALAMIAEIARAWTQPHPPLLSSFSMESLAAARQAAPDIPRAAIFAHGHAADWLATAAPNTVTSIHANKESLDRDAIAAIKAAGHLAGAYTVNSHWEAKRLFDAGVDYIFSDAPDEVMGAVSGTAE